MGHSSQQANPETPSTPGDGISGRDLFALTDEQILEMESEPHSDSAAEQHSVAPVKVAPHSSPDESLVDATASKLASTASAATATASEPPQWLADLMSDPQQGSEARNFWQNVEQARRDVAAYREVFSEPAAARAAEERARTLDQIDHAYFGGNAAERSKLAITMLREDPAAFREMVFEGLRALEEAEQGSNAARGTADSRLARAFGGPGSTSGQAAAAASAIGGASGQSTVLAATSAVRHANAEQDPRMAAYGSFEKSVNDDLERSVGAAIDRILEQALPNSGQSDHGALKSRLVGAIRLDVEKALQGDRQLGEQVAQLLSGKRFNDEMRTHLVRLIGERAEQLVPGAAKRIVSEWTQTTIAAHRVRTGRGAAASLRQEVPTVSTSVVDRNGRGNAQNKLEPARELGASVRGGSTRGVDYRKMSDEQILAM